ncbi:MAG: hypothetical protein M3540_05210 [Actinomycetota bacterium]|nr:hypothetical protein [Actinomycetota bacterium]
MRVTKVTVARTCAICERSLLMGERATRFAPDGDEFVDVCPLCQETAMEHGWIKEGSPTSPTVPYERRRRGLSLGAIFQRPVQAEAPIAPEPILRRLSESELQMVEAADLFNGSAYRRTIGGIGKSLGDPKASIIPLSGVNAELVITFAWDISWYQYRISPDSAQPVKLAERGHEPSELDGTYKSWNARVEEDGRIVPQIARL